MNAWRDPGRTGGVLRNSALLAVAKVLQRATGFAVSLLIAGHLGAEGLGVYATAWTIYGVIVIAGDAGVAEYLVREISRDHSRTASYLVHLSVVSFGAAVVLMLIAWAVVPRLGYSDELQASVLVVLLAILPAVLNTIQEAVFVAHGRVGFEALTRFWTSMAYVLATAWLLQRGYGIPALLLALVVTEYVVAAVYFVLISRFIARLRLQLRWSLMLRLVRELRWFTASAALAAPFVRPEILILSLLATERQVGLYSAALRLAELPLLFSEVFMKNMFPLLSEAFGRAEDRFAAWQTVAVRVVLAFSLPLAGFFIAAADPIVRLLYGEDLAAAAPLLRILAITVVFFSLIAIFWRSLVARDRQRSNVAVQGLMVGVRLGGAVLLIAPLAAVGAAIASVMTTLVHLLLLARATARSGAHTPICRSGWRFAIAATAAGVLVSVLGRWLPLPVSLTGGAIVYLAASLAIGAITPDDRLLLRRLVGSPAT